jgi:hypothetical protein
VARAVMDRATPYHVPHSTQVAGYAVIYGGDDRYVGNIFLGGDPDRAYSRESAGPPALAVGSIAYGTAGYDGSPATFADYLARVAVQPGTDHERFPGVKQPAYLRRNVYLAGARPFEGEVDPLVLDATASVEVVQHGDAVHLQVELPENFALAGGTSLVRLW